ncbi:TonB-dependent receptor [Brevundimonas sp. SORGH_AS_0993]|uniref:TonB-dependent receptor n=1 Tax=Brevundimonas sp. SORGH_AS_0993 TaxID=3041794 RepID=UPI00278AFD51|nr:TonB-dependent receptor [Brevundimonas sp. SORGH_AS_0993]MDQ1154489.1 iron complex outermembrane receptor protein [Brevundimonas sp. SORGH_AS_0993]
MKRHLSYSEDCRRLLMGGVAASVLVASVLAAGGQAVAQEATASPPVVGHVEDIVVTARKVAERAQDVPASISVTTGEQLQAAGVNDIQGLTQRLPNVAMSGGIAGTLQGQVGIRGISTLVRNIGVESGVGFYVDGVYLGRPEAYNQELIDIDRIEVLRGPQGTLFGKNTIAGVFNIATKSPGDVLQGEGRVEVGNYDLYRLQAYVMGPLSDQFGFKLAAGYVKRDGVYENLSGGQNGDAIDTASYRASLYYTPRDTTKIVLSFDGLNDRGHPAFFQVVDLAGYTSADVVTQKTTPHRIDNNRPDSLTRDNYGLSLTAEQDVALGALTSITAWRRSRYDASLDDDQNQVDYLSSDLWSDTTEIFSQELRLAGRLGPKSRYTVGAYAYNQKVDTDRILTLGAGFGIPGNPGLTTIGSVKSEGYALFGDIDHDFSDRLSGSLGLRYSKEDKTVQFGQNDQAGVFSLLGLPTLNYAADASDGDLSPTVSLSYKATPSILLYGRIAKGFKSAAFNVDLVSSVNGLSAGPESATSGEAGVKSDLFDRRLRVNAAVFTTRYDDLQVSQLLGSGVTLSNAGKATINGAELELTAFVAQGLRLDFSGGYTDATYDRFENCSVPTSLGGGSADCSGKRVIGAPRFTVHASAEQVWPVSLGELVARIDFSGQSEVYYEATNSDRFKGDARSVVDFRFGLRTSRWDAFAWVKNVGDEAYETYMDDRSAIGVLKTTAYGEPRTFGLTLTARF